MRTDRNGQAFIEMALGLFAFVFILAALLTFGRIIPQAQRYRSLARWKAGYNAQHANAQFDTAMNGTTWSLVRNFAETAGVGAMLPDLPDTTSPNPESFSFETDIRGDIGNFASDEVFGVDSIRLRTDVYLPGMSVPGSGRSEP